MDFCEAVEKKLDTRTRELKNAKKRIAKQRDRIADLEAQNAKLLALVRDIVELTEPPGDINTIWLAHAARALLAELDKGESE
jgi:DNA-binding ferritin-like protein